MTRREEQLVHSVHEVERLEAVRSYALLDTPAEAAFDALVALAAALMEAPVALVSLIDDRRQWYKSQRGLPVPETPRDETFCRYVLVDDAPIIVPDARLDPRFAEHPAVVCDPGVRFYASMPLRNAEGFVLGTLCVVDYAPRAFTDAQHAVLAGLAAQAMTLLELRRTEHRLRAERATLLGHQRFFEVSHDPMCTIDRATRAMRSANPAYTALLGRSYEELVAMPLTALVHPDDFARTRDEAVKLKSLGKQMVMRFEVRLRHREGWWVPTAWSVSMDADTIYAMGRDLSRERSSELALHDSEGRLSSLFDNMAEGVVMMRATGDIVACNPAALRILGLAREQVLGPRLLPATYEVLRDDGTPFPFEEHPPTVVLRTAKPVTDVVLGLRPPNGATAWLRVSARPLFSAGHAAPYGVYVLFHDVTAERDAQTRSERLAKQERLVTTGALAAGVGHEINNPLAFVCASLEYALDELRGLDGPRYRGLVQSLLDARGGAERIRGVVQGLKALGRDPAEPTPTHVPTVVELSLNMAMHELRQRASVVLDLTPVPPVLADESRLAQILVNLLINAGQAFETNNPTRNRVVVRCSHTDDTVTLSVFDNGPGIEPAVLGRIFEPFFTTKAVGEGAGLGLSVSQNLAASLGGVITCESTVGRGARFHVTLPVAQSPRPSQPSITVVSPPKRGRVLVIDDEVPLLRVIARGLGSHCDVVTESDPREALELLCTDAHFDVVLCDIIMPHLTGADLFRLVKARAPHRAERFVFMTGGVSRSGVADFFAAVPNQCLEKPVTLQALREIVQLYTRDTERERLG